MDLFIDGKAVDREKKRILDFIRISKDRLGREGAIVGLSGGIDSALTVSLSVSALGKENVIGVILPEKESDPISRELALEHGRRLGIEMVEVDITGILESIGTYSMRDKAVRSVMGDIPAGSKWNITLPGNLRESRSMNIYRLNLRTPDGKMVNKRLGLQAMKDIMSSTNTKQRARMLVLYLQAEMRGHMVVGTTNRSEYLMGYYLKYGDGGVDIEPISHLFKTEVYKLAERFDIPQGIVDRVPSPDTFSEPVSDNDFFFRVDYDVLDRFLAGWERDMDAVKLAETNGMSRELSSRILEEIQRRYDVSIHLREQPYSLERINS